jgi:hypothetical protein
MYVVLLAIMVFTSAALAGLFAPPQEEGTPSAAVQDNYHCCDTGDGPDCKPRTDVPIIKHNGKNYALLKSNTYPIQKNHQAEHLQETQTVTDAGRVFENIVSEKSGKAPNSSCNGNGVDYLKGQPDPNVEHGSGCNGIPNNLLVYVCRADNGPGSCDGREGSGVAFDVYIDVDEVNRTGIPEPILNCTKPPKAEKNELQIAFKTSPGGQKNLQLRTFEFVQNEDPHRWHAPWCKPAIYLYPERKAEINVSIFPQGKMLLTIPPYPKKGWDVVAEPDGDVYYQNQRFDYLYYEASIPDQIIDKPREGYIISYDEREEFLRNLVRELGLNGKETEQFVEYWVPILPKAPYIFVGVISVSNLNEISPLLITPKPDNLIRISLYFEARNKSVSVNPPTILPVNRDGYTAVEWGGIVKQDKDHPFSCFM